MTQLKYRPDIDGLRSLAIIPVVLFHAGFSVFSGGYIGVDVFFVISGYLITSIILREQNNGSFRLSEFWARRARRILPAMIAVIITVLVAGWFLLAPLDYQDLGRTARYQAFFSSNVYFWKSAGYFDSASELKPLLHMWSLSVEEQFYLVFPLLCIALSSKRLNSRKASIFALLAIASLTYSTLLISSKPDTVFYLAHARAWELLAGSILATLMFNSRINLSPPQAQGLSLLGLTLILVSIFCYEPDTIFPGIAALPPVIGSVLLIMANTQKTLIGTLLSSRPLVTIGLISYSLYLWHWPLFAYAHYTSIDEFSLSQRLMLVAASVGLAYISWRWIENPARRMSWLQINRRALSSALCVIIVLAVCGQLIRKNEGYPLRLPEDARRYAMDREWYDHQTDCIRRDLNDVLTNGPCKINSGNENFDPRILAWGDSHNAAIMPALETLSREYKTDMLFSARSACLPLFDPGKSKPSECNQFNRKLLDVIQETGIKRLMITGRWSQPLYGEEYSDSFQPAYTEKEFSQLFEFMLNHFENLGISVWLVAEVPLQSFDVPVRLTKLALNGQSTEGYGRDKREHIERQSYIHQTMKNLQGNQVTILRPDTILCDNDFCRAETNGHSLYKDDDHLSIYGANYILDSLRPVFEAPR